MKLFAIIAALLIGFANGQLVDGRFANLYVAGSETVEVTQIDSSYTIQNTDGTILAVTSSDLEVDFPAADSTNAGRVITLINSDSSSGRMMLDGDAFVTELIYAPNNLPINSRPFPLATINYTHYGQPFVVFCDSINGTVDQVEVFTKRGFGWHRFFWFSSPFTERFIPSRAVIEDNFLNRIICPSPMGNVQYLSSVGESYGFGTDDTLFAPSVMLAPELRSDSLRIIAMLSTGELIERALYITRDCMQDSNYTARDTIGSSASVFSFTTEEDGDWVALYVDTNGVVKAYISNNGSTISIDTIPVGNGVSSAVHFNKTYHVYSFEDSSQVCVVGAILGTTNNPGLKSFSDATCPHLRDMLFIDCMSSYSSMSYISSSDSTLHVISGSGGIWASTFDSGLGIEPYWGHPVDYAVAPDGTIGIPYVNAAGTEVRFTEFWWLEPGKSATMVSDGTSWRRVE